MGMTSDDKTMILFFAGLGFMLLLIVWMVLDAANLSNCLSVGMQWVDHDCVVIEGQTE
jgi:hypothetical protein